MTAEPWTLVEDRMEAWASAHNAWTRLDERGRLVLNDGDGDDFHLIRLLDPRLAFQRVRVEMTATPAESCATALCVNGWGGVDLAVIHRDGRILYADPNALVTAGLGPDGRIHAAVEFVSTHPSATVGTFLNSHFYPGQGRDQFAFTRLAVYAAPFPTRLGTDRLRLVDVGAEDGLPPKWRSHLADLDITFIEPAPGTAAILRSAYPLARVIEAALLDQACTRPLHMTRLTGCSSLLRPDMALLARWAVAPCFEVIDQVEVRCERYDALHAAGAAPAPDFLKVDVQGVEYEVLLGFGDLLHDCLGVELEAQFYPVYQGQRLAHELIAHLAGYGLMLRRLEEQTTFDGDLVEVNAFFTRRLDEAAPVEQRRKMALIEQVAGLHRPDHGGLLARRAISSSAASPS